jgi:hypothetical protein
VVDVTPPPGVVDVLPPAAPGLVWLGGGRSSIPGTVDPEPDSGPVPGPEAGCAGVVCGRLAGDRAGGAAAVVPLPRLRAVRCGEPRPAPRDRPSRRRVERALIRETTAGAVVVAAPAVAAAGGDAPSPRVASTTTRARSAPTAKAMTLTRMLEVKTLRATGSHARGTAADER